MILILLLIFTNLASSDEYFRVFYKDKDTLNFVEGNPYYENTLKLFTERAIERRTLHQKPLTIEDAIITPEYLNQISEYDLEIINSSRWFNYSLVYCTKEIAQELRNLEFVEKVDKTNVKFSPMSISLSNSINYTDMILEKNNYGNADTQIKMLNIDFFHKMGFNGDSVLMGYLDTGYYLNGEVFDSSQLVAQYDFINNDEETANEGVIDVNNQDLHGTAVLSVVSGYYQDTLIGVASESKFLLAKTENLPSEENREEDYFLFGTEWLESQGAEIINASLGYSDFDDDEHSYTFSDFDGSTTLVSQAVNKSVDKGVTFINAVGNYGGGKKGKDRTLISPADADSVIAVGGLENNGENRAGLSSLGPNAKDEIRPHLMAQGLDVTTAINNSNTFFGVFGGTSFASPLIAGCGGLIKSMYKNLKNYELKDYMLKGGDRYSNPSNTFGYGKLNVKQTVDLIAEDYGPAISPYNIFQVNDKMRIVFYVYFNDNIDVNLLYKGNLADNTKSIKMKEGEEEFQYFADIKYSEFENNVIFLNLKVDYFGNSKEYTEDFVKIFYGNEIIRKGVDKFSLPSLVEINQEDMSVYIADNELIIENNLKKIEKFEINILDIKGKSLFLYSILIRDRKNVLKLDNVLSTGMYLIYLKGETSFLTKKIIYTKTGS